ncbi:hypothetical protein HPB49_019435 [Dermacentor silvarum]|uniref:Uncharacterized protein n=1 Tax=Dermacentor silvarum TaxID=543639 RepID=A0ACB8CZJ1_DERSI|nr:hypothetical protein HPB49_019435 [Dermacentor silvarum]
MFPARQEVGPAAAAFQYAAATCYPTSCSPPPQYAGFGPAVHGGLVDAVDWTGGGGYRYDDWAALQQQQQPQPTAQGLYGGYAAVPEPPTTSPDSGLAPSDLSGGTPSPGLVQPQPVSRPAPARSPYEWMMKPSYQVQPNPGEHLLHCIRLPGATVLLFIRERALVSRVIWSCDHTPPRMD